MPPAPVWVEALTGSYVALVGTEMHLEPDVLRARPRRAIGLTGRFLRFLSADPAVSSSLGPGSSLPAMSRPLIGITSYAQPARWGAWDLPAALVPFYYVESVDRAGGRPLLVPPVAGGVEETLEVLDGIIFSGGIDIEPSLYGAARDDRTDPAQPHRDAAEMALLKAALDRDLPILAICRGFQLLNILRGGDLIQHVPDVTGDERHRETPGIFSVHPVEVEAGTRLAAIIGERHDNAHSSHHQGVGRVGEGLVETAWAADGQLEALEDPSKRFALGVLWHPEMEEDKRLFEALVAEARRYRSERRAGG